MTPDDSPDVLDPDDFQSVQAALDGDEAAFTKVYRGHQGPVYRFALHMTGSVTSAEDVTQEVFVTLLKDGRRYDPAKGALLPFLYGIARILILRLIDNGRNSALEEQAEEIAGAGDVLQDLTRQETIEAVRRAVVNLPPLYREAVVLCDLENASYEEAAAAMECPVGTVRSRLSRGRSMLAERLAPMRAGEPVESAAPLKTNWVRSTQ